MLNARARNLDLKIHCFSSFFLTMLTNGYKRVQRWTRSKDVFSLDRIIFPVNLNNTHWCLAVINMKAKKFEYYDSLGGRNDKCLKQLRMWLQEESLDKKKEPFDVRNTLQTLSPIAKTDSVILYIARGFCRCVSCCYTPAAEFLRLWRLYMQVCGGSSER